MPSDSERDLYEEVFGKIDETLARLRAAAAAPPDPPEPWLKRMFGRSPPSSRQPDLNVALVDALAEAVAALRKIAASAKIQHDQARQDVTELRSLSENLRERSATIDPQLTQLREHSAAMDTQLTQVRQEESALRERFATIETLLAQLRQEQGEIRDRAATIGQELARSGPEQNERINQLAGVQENLATELRERIQHLLDEQRVCLRQLSLKTSEDAVLADRARRATELRLEEIARRLPEHPA